MVLRLDNVFPIWTDSKEITSILQLHFYQTLLNIPWILNDVTKQYHVWCYFYQEKHYGISAMFMQLQ